LKSFQNLNHTMPPPILIAPLLAKIDVKLIELLRSLSAEDWQKPTIVPLWNVHDIALHLLDTNLRTLSILRDKYVGVKPPTINSYQDLLGFLNKLNADWIVAMRRISPQILIELLEQTGKQNSDYFAELNPFDTATFSVAWAGEAQSANWFHTAREYTEKWHHQQKIRLALEQTDVLYTREFYFPHLDTSMRALPHHYRAVGGTLNEVIKVTITGESGGDWFLCHNGSYWELLTACTHEPICTITIENQIAWRMFTKGIARTEAEKYVKIEGKQELGEKIFDMLAVMA
jgi:hypothetical protein